MDFLISNDFDISTKKTYTEAQKRAIYNYRQKNKFKVNEQAKKDYIKSTQNPETVEKRRAYNREYMRQRRESKKEADKLQSSFNNFN